MRAGMIAISSKKIINNLLSNAFKFTPPGGKVELSVDELCGPGELHIRIMDTGKGIPPEDLPHIFSPFYQASHTADDGQPGTGIGLSLVQELVKLYGGTMSVESFINEGTIFSVMLPIAENRFPSASFISGDDNVKKAASAQGEAIPIDLHQPESDVEIKKLKQDVILIVEDNSDMKNYISSTLSDLFQILVAKDGEEGLVMAQ